MRSAAAQTSTCNSLSRKRKRGPRSCFALRRRATTDGSPAPAGTVTGESVTDVPAQFDLQIQPIKIYSINIKCLLAHIAELTYFLELHCPHVVCIQETWLDISSKEATIPNYNVLWRRDRSESPNRGGVITLVRDDVKLLAHMHVSAQAERMIHYLHVDLGIIAIVNWYRPPGSDLAHIHELNLELRKRRRCSWH